MYIVHTYLCTVLCQYIHDHNNLRIHIQSVIVYTFRGLVSESECADTVP